MRDRLIETERFGSVSSAGGSPMDAGRAPDDAGKGSGNGVLKSGTTALGLATADGVLVATDQRATARGRFVIDKNVQKVQQVHPRAVMTMVGPMGQGQMFVRTMRAEANLYETRRGKTMDIESLQTFTGKIIQEMGGLEIHPVLAGVDDDGHHVGSIDGGGGMLTDDYIASGSGMQLAYGVLEEHYEPDLPTEEAIPIAAEAVKSASARDTASGNGIYIAEVTDEGVDIRAHDDLEELL